MLNHGGNLLAARARFSHITEWLDLSTGISPWSWPVPELASTIWQRLPEITPSFEATVAAYYGLEQLIPVAGSQVAIELIPQLLPVASVALPRWGYAEHARSWQRSGHQIQFYDDLEHLNALLGSVEHAVVINPNNPTGASYSVQALRAIQQQVKGLLLVDEAFIDSAAITASRQGSESPSMLPYVEQGALVVLRSLGKFFGLAGVRLGFVALPDSLREAFLARLSVWSISTPSLWVAEQALADRDWHIAQLARINTVQPALLALLRARMPECQVSAGPLFVSVKGPNIVLKTVFEFFASQGIWLRLFVPREASDTSYLRFGLPPSLSVVEQQFDLLDEHSL